MADLDLSSTVPDGKEDGGSCFEDVRSASTKHVRGPVAHSSLAPCSLMKGSEMWGRI